MLHLSKYLDKLGRISLPLVLTLALAGCGASDNGAVHDGQADRNAGDYMSLTTLEEYGVAPLDLTARDQQLLEALPGYPQIMLVQFYAPEEATDIKVEAWYLDGSGQWCIDAAVADDLTIVQNPDEAGRGVISAYWSCDITEPQLTMKLNYYGGKASSAHSSIQSGALAEAPADGYGTMLKFLQQPTEIVLGEPVPLGIITSHDADAGQEVFSVNDYFNTEKFAGSLYTAAVTVTFLNDRGEDQVNIVHPDEN